MGILDTEYNEDKIRELFMEDGRREERVNTEIQRKRAEAEKARADLLEGEKARADSLEEENNRLKEEKKRLQEELANLKKIIAQQ